MKNILKIVLILGLILSQNIYSQCSDAGICVIGKHHIKEFAKKKNIASLGYIYGVSGKDADQNGELNNLSFGSFKFEADIEIPNALRVNASIPFTFISGSLGENNGIGDLAVVLSKSFVIKKKNILTFSLGGKFATGKVNSNDSLPQRYMTGLGTNDLIIGAVYTRDNYYFGIGYQKSFGRSSNYVTRLKRGDDVFVRAGFFEEFNKVGVKAEILTILRLQASSVRDPLGAGESFITVGSSNETQVNMLCSANYHASDGLTFGLFAAIPFLKRNYNFDGLKRTLTISGIVSYSF